MNKYGMTPLPETPAAKLSYFAYRAASKALSQGIRDGLSCADLQIVSDNAYNAVMATLEKGA